MDTTNNEVLSNISEKETPMSNNNHNASVWLTEAELFGLAQNLPQGKSLLDICREVSEAQRYLISQRREIEALLNAPEPVAAPKEADANSLPPRSLEELQAAYRLTVDPKSAIQEEKIVCCICGKEVQSLTSRHLRTHGLSVEEYKLLCGYAPNTALMSAQRYQNAQHAISAAQGARKNPETPAEPATKAQSKSPAAEPAQAHDKAHAPDKKAESKAADSAKG